MSVIEAKLDDTERMLLATSREALLAQSSRRSRIFKNLCIVFLIFVFTVVITETIIRIVVYWAQVPQSYSKEFDIKYALAQKPLKAGANGILLLGNSQLWHALFPELIAHRLKRAGYLADIRSLAVNGTTPEMNLFLLKKAIKSGAKPKLVVYNVAPILLNHEYYVDSFSTAEGAFSQSYLGECYFRPRYTIQAKLSCALKKKLQFIRYQKWVSQQVAILSQNYFWPSNIIAASSLGAPLTESSPNGWSPDYELVSDEFDAQFTSPEFLQIIKRGKSLNNFHLEFSHIEQLRNFCQKSNIPLLMVWLPEHPAMKKIYRYFRLPSPDAFKVSFQSLSYPHKQIWFLDLSESDSNPEHYYNPDHLNLLGALPLSDKFAHLLLSRPYKKVLLPSSRKDLL